MLKENEKVNALMIEGQDEMSYAYAKILDAEGDVFECSFLSDGCVTIDTKELEYIILTKENLNTLKRLINEAEKYYDSDEAVSED
jgi:hypothetical protein